MASIIGTYFQRNSSSIFPNNNTGTKSKNMSNVSNNKKDINDKLGLFSKTEQNSGFSSSNSVGINSIITSSQSYAEQLRVQRQQTQATSLKLKKLKYRFKNISSKIIRSKTSYAAKQVAGQARREVLRLKNEKKQSGEDSAELDAAIAHAKTMERVAKKKAKHLEEEEMIKVSGGPCADRLVEEEEKLEDTNDLSEAVSSQEAGYEQEQEISYDEMAKMMSELSENMQAMIENMQAMSEAMSQDMESMTEDMQDLLEDVGLGELTEAITPSGEEIDPEDLKQLKIKHRNKEMQEIAKADAEYLKAIFDILEKGKDSGVSIEASVKNTVPSQTVAVPQVSVKQTIADEKILPQASAVQTTQPQGAAFAAGGIVAEPVINITV